MAFGIGYLFNSNIIIGFFVVVRDIVALLAGHLVSPPRSLVRTNHRTVIACAVVFSMSR